jgi:hypothetical protein
VDSCKSFRLTLALDLTKCPDIQQYPGEQTPSEKIETALSTGHEDLSRVRARNALKILLDVHSDFERKGSVPKTA